MSTPPTLKRNGKSKRAVSPGFEATQFAADTLGVIDSRFASLEDSIARLHSEAIDFRHAMIESHDAILKELRGLRREEVSGG